MIDDVEGTGGAGAPKKRRRKAPTPAEQLAAVKAAECLCAHAQAIKDRLTEVLGPDWPTFWKSEQLVIDAIHKLSQGHVWSLRLKGHVWVSSWFRPKQ
jgi:hypothetical protein